jgi:hypothetical protein
MGDTSVQGTVTWRSSGQLARCVAVLSALSVSVTMLELRVSCMVQGRRGQHGHLSRPHRAGQDASSSGVCRSKVGKQQYGSRTALLLSCMAGPYTTLLKGTGSHLF